MQKAPLRLADAVSAVEQTASLVQRQSHALAVRHPAGEIVQTGDTTRIVQGVTNVLANAA